MGIKTADSKEVTGNLEKEYLDKIDALAGEKIDIIQLYGTKGIGEVAKYAYVGQAVATPNDVGGIDEILEMTVTIVPNSAAKKVTDDFTVVDNGDGTFTVSKNTVTPSVTLNQSTATVRVGETITLSATTVPADATVTWTSDAETYATVANGVVTGVAEGSANITATITVDGTDYTATCAVTVDSGV